MKEDQVRLVLAVALSALVLIVWQHFFGPKPRAVAAMVDDGGAPTLALADAGAGAPVVAAAVPTLNAPPPLVPAVPNPPEETVEFDSSLRRFVFSSYGGTLRSAVLKGEQFKKHVDGKDIPVDLVQVRRSGDAQHPGPDPLPLTLELGKGLPPLSPDQPFQVEKQADGVTFTAQVGDLTVTKRYRVPADGYDVQLDVTLREKLRDFAARQHLTHGGVAIDAIEAHAGELATHWTPDQANQGTGLFPTTTRHRVRTQVSAPTQLRMTPEVARVHDNLVTQWSAPSRSALVNEALRRYLTQHETP